MVHPDGLEPLHLPPMPDHLMHARRSRYLLVNIIVRDIGASSDQADWGLAYLKEMTSIDIWWNTAWGPNRRDLKYYTDDVTIGDYLLFRLTQAVSLLFKSKIELRITEVLN